jgi:large subunit ribosomal protein L28
MAQCDICGKATSFGRNVSHSKRHTNRRFLPNIQPATVYRDGEAVQLYICTRCLRSYYKETRPTKAKAAAPGS